MKLMPAPGSSELREAHASPYIHKIASFLYQYLDADPDFFSDVALFLRNQKRQVTKNLSVSFTQKLKELCERQNYPHTDGSFTSSSTGDELKQVIAEMYEQDQEKLDFQRGAILELLTFKLVNSHCTLGDCKINHKLVDNDPFIHTRQIDVAALSMRDRQIEGYSCKVSPVNPNKSYGLKREDCANLMAIADHGLVKSFSTHLGVVGKKRKVTKK